MEETENETTEETIYVYEYPANSQSDTGDEGKVITLESKESPEEEEVTTVTQYVEEVVEIDNENVVVANVMAASEKGSIKLVLAEEEDDRGEHGYTMNYRPIRPVERQKMRPWLLEHLDSGSIPGLSWQNRTQRIFRISWKHAAHNCFNRTRDSDLFERWAYHTGRHHDGNHKRWKANFRCALNSLPDVIELRDLGVRKGDNAFKVYKFIDLNDEKEREEKKRLQMVTRSSKKTENKKGSSTPSTPAGIKQLKTESSPPAAFSITATEGGMLQTLLHAIELKNQEAATDVDDDKKSKDKIQLTVKRSLDQENQPRSKRSRRETEKNQHGEDTESSEEEEDSETASQVSSTSHTPGAMPSTPTSGQSVINMLKLPYILDMKQLLALAGNKQKDMEGKSQSQDKMTITNVTLDSVLQDRLTRNTDSSNVKITIPYTVFEALKAKNLAAKNPVTLESTPSTMVLTQTLDSNKDTAQTMTKPQSVLSNLTSNKESAAYPNIRSRLVSRLNISGAQVVGQGQIRPTLVSEENRKTFEKVTVQAIPQLQPVNVGSSGEESEQDSKINISPVNINADVSQSETPTSSQSNKDSADVDHVTEQVTVELSELTEDQLSAEVVGGEPGNQFTVDKRDGKKRTVMTHCNLFLNAACPGCGLARDGLTSVIQSALDLLKSPQYDTLSYQIPIMPSSPLVITNRRYFGCLEEDLDPVTVTLTPEGQLNINVLFKPLEKILVKMERGELDVQTFQWTLERLVSNVFCPGVSVTHYPAHWDVHVREFEEPFHHVQSLTCPVWYIAERSDEFPISVCGGCQEATDSLAVKQEETIETEIIVMHPDIAEQVFDGNISHVEVSEEVTGHM